MRYLIILPIFLSSAGAFGQDALGDSAFANFHRGNYIGAIVSYKKVVARDHYGFEMELLALSYLKADSIPQAKEMFEKTISLNSKIPDYAVDASRELADLYYREKNYKKAINYYQLYGKLWENARFSDVNRFAFKYGNSINLANCYKKLKLIDSAIVEETPYVFCNYLNLKWGLFRFGPDKTDLPDSLKHDSICREYISLLQVRHRLKNIKRELKRTELGFQYTEEAKFFGKDSMYVSKQAHATFTFYGAAINYDWDSSFARNETMPAGDKVYFTREFYLRRFRATRLYHIIADL